MSKRTWNRYIGTDWDYYYLLKLEQLKLRRMRNYQKKHGCTMSTPFNIRDMDICDRLISIILEEDKVNKAYTKKAIADKENDKLTWIKDVVYVNTRNEYRFFSSTPIKKNIEDKNPYKGEHGQNYRDKALKMSLRRLKALHLYNLIREYRMFSWWD